MKCRRIAVFAVLQARLPVTGKAGFSVTRSSLKSYPEEGVVCFCRVLATILVGREKEEVRTAIAGSVTSSPAGATATAEQLIIK